MLCAASCENQRTVCFVIPCANANCGSLRRLSAGRRKLHNADGSARMMVTHLNLAEIQDRQAVALFIGELIGRQRHLVLCLMATELPHCVDAHRKPQMSFCVDHTSRLLSILIIACVCEMPTFRSKVELPLVRSSSHLHVLFSRQYQSQPWLLKDEDSVTQFGR